MSDPIITVEGLGKRYRLGARNSGERYTALRDVVAEAATRPFRSLRDKFKPKNGSSSADFNLNTATSTAPIGAPSTSTQNLNSRTSKEDFWALRDVSFEVKRGEVLGIIGRNGAGKSTLLKILSRITDPTEGRIKIKGRVASLLEVGTGFHPELTGRENIFLNGAILGMTKAEIKAKFDEIVAFAEVEKFLDTPVKRYSSGMYVRLAFAVAAHLEPEILVVDEVLAVGDAEFQKKCLGKMQQVAKGEGRTVLFVSHNMSSILSLCPRAILLSMGSIQLDNVSDRIVPLYLQQQAGARQFRLVSEQVRPDRTQIRAVTAETFGDVLTIFVEVFASNTMQISLDVRVKDFVGTPVAFASLGTLNDGDMLKLVQGFTQINVSMPLEVLANGSYRASVDLTIPFVEYVDRAEDCVAFDVERPAAGSGSRNLAQQWNKGSLQLPLHLLSANVCQFAPLG